MNRKNLSLALAGCGIVAAIAVAVVFFAGEDKTVNSTREEEYVTKNSSTYALETTDSSLARTTKGVKVGLLENTGGTETMSEDELNQKYDNVNKTNTDYAEQVDSSLSGIKSSVIKAVLQEVEPKLVTMNNKIEGAQGVDGKDGKTGATGATGATGPQGKTGATGPQGKQGIQGEKGADGKDGQDGKDGLDGQDGLDGKSVYIVYSQYASGIDENGNVSISKTPTSDCKYMGTASATTDPGTSDAAVYTWTQYKESGMKMIAIPADGEKSSGVRIIGIN